MKHRGAKTDHTHSQKNQKIILGKGQQKQANQCEANTDGKCIGTGMLAGRLYLPYLLGAIPNLFLKHL